jgi:hypothetical protein
MADDKDNRDQPAAPKSSGRPSHFAYSVRENQEGKSYFNRVGAVFPHKDGQGFNVDLESVPLSGKIVLRSPLDRLDQMRECPPQGRDQGEREK